MTQEALLDLCVDSVHPLFRALGLLLRCRYFGLQVRNPILGGAQLIRKPLRRLDRVSAFSSGAVGGLLRGC